MVKTAQARTERGLRIRAERERLEMSQEAFGKLGGVGRATQFLYEHGDRDPNADYLVRISEAGADAHWILFGTARPKPAIRKADTPAQAFQVARDTAIQLVEVRDSLGLKTQPFDKLLNFVMFMALANDIDVPTVKLGSKSREKTQ